MKHATLAVLILLLCLALPGLSTALASEPVEQELPPLTRTIQQHVNEGYKVLLGPIQYLGKTESVISLYRHSPVAYSHLTVINQFGEPWFVREEDFVYILARNGRLVLIRIHKNEGGEQ